MKVHILDLPKRHFALPAPADWYPVYLNQRLLRNLGLTTKFFSSATNDLFNCDVLCLSSRFFELHSKDDSAKQDILSDLARYQTRVDRLLWFDWRDSTGSTSFEVMPYVDSYLKKQLLKDRSLYRQSFYGNRIYTDYIHNHFNISDDYSEYQSPLPAKYQSKLDVSWNPGLLDFRGGTVSALATQRLTDSLAITLGSSTHFRWQNPHVVRSNNLLATFNTRYARQTIAWQRASVSKILDSLSDNKIMYQQKIPIDQEIAARYDSKIVLSLFGWGELCSRDYQTFIAGAALIAPDTSHLATWPQTHIPEVTYAPIKWDLSNLVSVYQTLINNDNLRLAIAHGGQDNYRQLWSKEGRETVALHIKHILDGKSTIQDAPPTLKSFRQSNDTSSQFKHDSV